jgi:hypothetical protein
MAAGLAMAGAAVLPILGAMLGKALSAGDREAADKLRRQIMEQYGPEALKELEVQAAQQADSGLNGYQADEEAVGMQRQALRRLQEDASTVGLTEAERAEMEDVKGEAAQYEQGQRGAILQNAQARGISGSGLQMAQQLAAQQGGAMRANRMGMDAAKMAAQRRALANMQMGQMAGQFRGQGFGEASGRAQAQDAINRFNAANTNQANQFNSSLQMQGKNQQSAAMGDYASTLEQRAKEEEEMWANLGSAGARAASGFGK